MSSRVSCVYSADCTCMLLFWRLMQWILSWLADITCNLSMKTFGATAVYYVYKAAREYNHYWNVLKHGAKTSNKTRKKISRISLPLIQYGLHRKGSSSCLKLHWSDVKQIHVNLLKITYFHQLQNCMCLAEVCNGCQRLIGRFKCEVISLLVFVFPVKGISTERVIEVLSVTI